MSPLQTLNIRHQTKLHIVNVLFDLLVVFEANGREESTMYIVLDSNIALLNGYETHTAVMANDVFILDCRNVFPFHLKRRYE